MCIPCQYQLFSYAYSHAFTVAIFSVPRKSSMFSFGWAHFEDESLIHAVKTTYTGQEYQQGIQV